MKHLVLIACRKCGYMINGRPWRCPGCGGADEIRKSGKIGESHRGLISRLFSALSRK